MLALMVGMVMGFFFYQVRYGNGLKTLSDNSGLNAEKRKSNDG